MSKELNLFEADDTDSDEEFLSDTAVATASEEEAHPPPHQEPEPESATADTAPKAETVPEAEVTPPTTEATVNLHPAGSATASHLERMIDKIRDRKDRENAEEELVAKGKKIVEALLFASNEPLSFNRIRDIIEVKYPIKPRHLKQAIAELREEYVTQDRAFRLEEVGNGYLLCSSEEYSVFIDQVYRNRRTEKLSHAATEVLAIVAHRQPITRPQVDAIRGVDSSGTVAALLERGLIEGVGKLEAPGRPTLYGVTQDFLKYFGLKAASDLPVEEAANPQGL